MRCDAGWGILEGGREGLDACHIIVSWGIGLTAMLPPGDKTPRFPITQSQFRSQSFHLIASSKMV